MLIAPQFAVVPLLGLFEARQVRFECLHRGERRAVDALHRLIPRITLPVRVGRAEQLEGLQPARRRDVRPGAEVDEGTRVFDGVAGHGVLAHGLLVDELSLERFAPADEELHRLAARPHLPLVGEVLLRQLSHFPFNRLEVFRHEWTRDDEIVEEPVIGGRANTTLDIGKQDRHGGGQQVGGTVPIQVQRFWAVARDDTDRAVGLQGIR